MVYLLFVVGMPGTPLSSPTNAIGNGYSAKSAGNAGCIVYSIQISARSSKRWRFNAFTVCSFGQSKVSVFSLSMLTYLWFDVWHKEPASELRGDLVSGKFLHHTVIVESQVQWTLRRWMNVKDFLLTHVKYFSGQKLQQNTYLFVGSR